MKKIEPIIKQCITCNQDYKCLYIFSDGECLDCKQIKDTEPQHELELGIKRVYASSELALKNQYPGVIGVRPCRPGSGQWTGTLLY